MPDHIITMSNYTVVVTDHDFDNLAIERKILSGTADIVELSDDVENEVQEPIDSLSEADAVINLRFELGEEDIAAMDDVRVISRYGIGVDNIDLEAATNHGIPVTNVPSYCLEEVSIHALTLMLALSRGVNRYRDSVARGEWDRGVAAPINRFSTQTVGIVGYGAIGREVGARANALGANILVSDPFVTEDDVANDPASLVSLEKLLEKSDFITIHSPLNDKTEKMFDSDAFSRMKESAYLVNVARGPIVDGDALHNALEDGEIAGAGLDVFPDEPPAPDNPLRSHESVVASPHVAWYSEEANAERRRTVAHIVKSALTGDPIENVVNDVE